MVSIRSTPAPTVHRVCRIHLIHITLTLGLTLTCYCIQHLINERLYALWNSSPGIAASEGGSAAWAAALGRTGPAGWWWQGRGHEGGGARSGGGAGEGAGGAGGGEGAQDSGYPPSQAELEAAELPCIRYEQ